MKGSFTLAELGSRYEVIHEAEEANDSCDRDRYLNLEYPVGVRLDFEVSYSDEETGWPDPNPGADRQGRFRIIEALIRSLELPPQPRLTGRNPLMSAAYSIGIAPCTKVTVQMKQLRTIYDASISAKLYHFTRPDPIIGAISGDRVDQSWTYHGRFSGKGKIHVFGKVVVDIDSEKLPNCCCNGE